MEGLLKPELREEQIGSIEVRNTFKIPKVGTIAGCQVIKGKIVRVVPEDEMVEALVAEAERLVAEGVEARLAAADAGAEAEAEADRRDLLDAKGADANASESKVELIRKRFGDEADPAD